MRKHILLAAMLLVAGLVPTAFAAASPQGAPVPPAAHVAAGPTAADLLAKVQGCKQISKGKFKTDDETGATIPVCDANGAVFWKADMAIDCDGRRTSQCSENTDCCVQEPYSKRAIDERVYGS